MTLHDTLNAALAAGTGGLVLALGAGWARCSAALERALAERNNALDDVARERVFKENAREEASHALIDLHDARQTLNIIAIEGSGSTRSGTARRFGRLARETLANMNSFRPRPIANGGTGCTFPTDR